MEWMSPTPLRNGVRFLRKAFVRMVDQLTTTVGGDMLVTHLGRKSVALSAIIVAAACGGGDSAEDSVNADTGAVQSASGDVAGSNVNSPAMVTSFLATVNQGEIEAGQLGTTKATNAQVRQYAQMLVTEHRRADTMVRAAGGTGTGTGTAGTGTAGTGTAGTGTAGTGTAGAAGAGGQVAADLQQRHQQAMRTLQDTPKGRAWDSTFVALMVTEHQDVLTRLEGMRGTGGTSGTAAGTTGGTGTGATGTGATGTTQPAGQANQGDQTQAHLQHSIEMVRKHLERGQELQRTLQGSGR